MLKHVRKALEMAGAAGVEYHCGSKHPYLTVNGKRVIVSASPKNPHHAALNIARDIEKARGAQWACTK